MEKAGFQKIISKQLDMHNKKKPQPKCHFLHKN